MVSASGTPLLAPFGVFFFASRVLMSAISCSMFLRDFAYFSSSAALKPPAAMASLRALSRSVSSFWSFWVWVRDDL
ncbi:hypothetical protein D3C78_1318360 [compost metagenome]